MKKWFIHKLGGYADINEAIEAIKEKDTKDKFRILSLATKHLFNTINEEDILKENVNGQWMFEGRILNKVQQELIKAETNQFINSTLWKVLEKDIKWQAGRKMFILAQNEVQVAAGKLWLYMLDAFKTRLQSISKSSATFNYKKPNR